MADDYKPAVSRLRGNEYSNILGILGIGSNHNTGLPFFKGLEPLSKLLIE